MYRYTIEPMPGQKAKFAGDASVKYQVTRHNTAVATKHKKMKDIIRTNLDYDEAVALIKIFNDREVDTQKRRDEKAQEGNVS
jgi:hypothetical protein